MIVVCPNCNKKFNIDEKLIPENGRLLKCSNCNHTWHYTLPDKDQIEIIEKDNNKEITINKEKNNEADQNISISESKSASSKKNKLFNLDKDLKNKTNINKNKKKSGQNLLSMIFVFLISFIALILLIDTFKLYIVNFFPDIITILDNLYATLHDLILFFKDLFN
tara:strand:- start:3837 stop:4331 length:495 start_codon:yes stop_codon:yes gene_type:complete